MYATEADPDAREGIAVALSAIANDEVLDEVIKLASDRNNGTSRIFFLLFLGRSRDPEFVDALRAFAKDPELSAEAKAQLRKNGEDNWAGLPKALARAREAEQKASQ